MPWVFPEKFKPALLCIFRHTAGNSCKHVVSLLLVEVRDVVLEGERQVLRVVR